jgi:D-alanyl-D-alanine carboxypeptidase
VTRSAVAALLLAVSYAAVGAPSAGMTDRVTSTMNDVITRTGLPGMTVSFYGRDGLHAYAVGWADRESHSPMTPRSVMMGASTGKMLVAVLAYQEIVEGLLHYDDKVSKYLGTDATYDKLPGASQFTIQMLLTHSTGLPDGLVDYAAMRDSSGEWTNHRRYEAALDTKLLFEPGTAYSYSDFNYQLLAAVIESIEGQYFGDLAELRIIGPLHLIDTNPATHKYIKNLASGYAGPTTKPHYEDIQLPNKTATEHTLFMYPAFEGGGDGFSTTASDLARFLYGVFGTPLIGETERRHMTEHWVPIPPKTANRAYGAGIFKYVTALGTAYGHGGLWFGYKTQVQYFPSICIAAALQVNSQIDGEGNDLTQFHTRERNFGMVALLTELLSEALVQRKGPVPDRSCGEHR